MSADNGVYIGKFKDGFRVAHGFSIGNTKYPTVESDQAKEAQAELWRLDAAHSLDEVFENAEDALEAAWEFHDNLLERYHVIEYGVSWINFPHKFPKEYKDNE